MRESDLSAGGSVPAAAHAAAGLLAALGRRAMSSLGLPDRMLRPQALVERAGCGPALAAVQAEAPLGILLEDYRSRADLTLFGCLAARFDILRLLRNLAALQERAAREPELLAAPVTAPVFITGMPRSGSTFLHKVLAEDPGNRSPSVWETVYPLPRSRDDPPARRIATVNRQLAAFERMAPGFRDAHPINAASPQECTAITAHAFRSFRFDMVHNVPRYRSWLRAADQLPAYRFHRVFLQHLQHAEGGRRRWVLKSPDNVFALEALAEVYPDARLVFLHRDPLEVLASVAGLTAILRRPFTSRLDRQAIGRQVTGDWLAGTEAMIRAHAQRLFPPERVVHLHFRDLVRAPMASVAALYEQFGLPLGAAARQRMERCVAELPQGGYGRLTHSLEEFGIDRREARERFAAYADYFGVQG
ncbi:MAG TPA: sulfotransferase [Crenalkalicoccus sp.]|nr:sulfotransferase [Crenalkalicoccus sp.]